MGDGRIARRSKGAEAKRWGRLHCRIDEELHKFLSGYAERHNISMTVVIEQLITRLREQDGFSGVQQL
jgi:predicted HicB family RNase H-like nuclease